MGCINIGRERSLHEEKGVALAAPFLRRIVEAATGFEPVNNGFADRRLPTWLRRLKKRHTVYLWMRKERETGLEPATPTLARLCSTN